MADLIRPRSGTAALWASANPILAQGEIGFTTDTGIYRIGDGVSHWLDLPAMAAPMEGLSVTLDATTDPGATASGKLMLYAKAIANRMMVKMVGPSGLDTPLQPFLGRNKVGYWDPPGNATTVPGVFGYAAPTMVGTATSRVIATTNLFNRMRRIGYVSTAVAGQLVSARVPAAQVTVGGTQGAGFHNIIRFGISDPAYVTSARMFIGMSTSTSAPTNVEPSTLKNCIGVGHGAADTNLMLYSAGSAGNTPINLGANFPLTSNTDPYELALFAPPGDDSVYWEVTRLSTGDVASGVVTNGGGLNLPGTTSLMTYLWAYRTNNVTALAVALDLMGMYIETDY